MIQKLLQDDQKGTAEAQENLLVGTSAITAAALNNLGTTLATGLSNGVIQFYDCQDENLITVAFAHIDAVTKMEYCVSGRLVTGGLDANIKVWTFNSKREIQLEFVFIKHSDSITNISVLPPLPGKDDDRVFSSDKTGQGFFWEVNSDFADSLFNYEEGMVAEIIDSHNIAAIEIKGH